MKSQKEMINLSYKREHPGKRLQNLVLIPAGLGINKAASDLGVSPSTISRLVSGASDMTPSMAVRLEQATGHRYTAEDWMKWQSEYDIEKARNEDSATTQKIKEWKIDD